MLGDWEHGLVVDQPITFIHGADEPFTAPAEARRFARVFPGDTSFVEADAGHLMCGSDPRAFWTLLAEHLPSVWPEPCTAVEAVALHPSG